MGAATIPRALLTRAAPFFKEKESSPFPLLSLPALFLPFVTDQPYPNERSVASGSNPTFQHKLTVALEEAEFPSKLARTLAPEIDLHWSNSFKRKLLSRVKNRDRYPMPAVDALIARYEDTKQKIRATDTGAKEALLLEFQLSMDAFVADPAGATSQPSVQEGRKTKRPAPEPEPTRPEYCRTCEKETPHTFWRVPLQSHVTVPALTTSSLPRSRFGKAAKEGSAGGKCDDVRWACCCDCGAGG